MRERERVREKGGEREGEVCVLSACQKITYTFSYWSLLNLATHVTLSMH